MKTKLFSLLLLASTALFGQVTEVISNQFAGATEAVLDGNNMNILLLGASGESEFRRVDLSASSPSVQDVFTNPDALTFTIDGSVSYIFGLFGGVTQADTADFTSNTTALTNINGLALGSIVIGDFLYFTTSDDNLSRIDLNNPTTPEVVIPLNFPQGLELIGNELFIAITGDNAIGKIDITDPAPTIEIVATGFDEPSSITASGSTLYVGELGAGSRVLSIDTSLTNPTPVELATIGGNITGLSVFEDDLYFVNSATGSLLRLDDVLSVDDQSTLLNEIKVYSNPNNGGAIQLSNIGSNNVEEIKVYDMGGRMIYQNRYTSSVKYVENDPIHTNAVSGTYIIAISAGNGVQIRKLIITNRG